MKKQAFIRYSSTTTERITRVYEGMYWRPPTDFYETCDALIVRVEVSGISESDFSISLAGTTLRIEGLRQESCEKLCYFQMEIAYGAFCTEIKIPENVLLDFEHLETAYTNGFLSVRLPKLQPQLSSI
ncbi:MAG: Hsp20/alpha crystallin family protein [Deltaproteobacteria bacterium]|nr:Hsp20/alpha crystallin family protein [Deltaproteobacteria bacterium]